MTETAQEESAMTDNIYHPHFLDEDKAREHLEAIRWPDGAECPHCGLINATKLEGKAHRKGLYQCNACREQFSVTVGTVFERSKVPLHKWLLATHLMCSSKKGISAHQLHRMLGVTYKTAWFMAHRIREAMKQDGGPSAVPAMMLKPTKPTSAATSHCRRTAPQSVT
jgi:transposase-like protein